MVFSQLPNLTRSANCQSGSVDVSRLKGQVKGCCILARHLARFYYIMQHQLRKNGKKKTFGGVPAQIGFNRASEMVWEFRIQLSSLFAIFRSAGHIL